MEDSIVLNINGETIHFSVNDKDYNDFVNQFHPTNKVNPCSNLLMRSVLDTDKEALRELLKQPGAAVNIAPVLVEQYQPQFNITVGE